MALAFMIKLYNNVVSFIYLRSALRTHDQSRFTLFNNGWAGKLVARFEGRALVNRRIDITALLGKVRAPRAFAGIGVTRIFSRQLEVEFGPRPAGDYPPIDNLQRDIGSLASIQRFVSFFERNADLRQMLGSKNAVWQRHRNLVPLSYIAHI